MAFFCGVSVRILCCLLFLFACNVYSQALQIGFDRSFIQGALITGKTNALVMRVDKRDIAIDSDGRFVFGLGRNANSNVELELFGENGEQDRRIIAVQQREYPLQRITGVEQKYVSPPPEVIARIRKDAQIVSEARQINRRDAYEYLMSATWPAEGAVTGVYGSQRVFNGVPKRPHYGLDIAGPVGQAVFAPLSGKVTLAEPDLYYSGGTLIVDHGRGVSSTFIHLSKMHVDVGDYVQQGQRIADIGASGRVTGPHLDWRLNWFDVRLDPELILPERSDTQQTVPKEP